MDISIKRNCFLMSMGIAVGWWIAFTIQSTANRSVNSCSYLDPITVDIAAMIIGLFIFGEGLYDFYRHIKTASIHQLARCARVGIATAIITIHVMQFIHK